MTNRAELALGEACAKLGDGGQEPAVVGGRKHDARARGSLGRRLGTGAVERERLFHEDVLSRLGGRDDLSGVLRIGGGEHHSVHVRAPQDLGIVVADGEPGAVRELGRVRGGPGDGGHKPDRLATALDRIDDAPAPAPQPDDGRVDHVHTPARLFEGRDHGRHEGRRQSRAVRAFGPRSVYRRAITRERGARGQRR